MNILKKVIIWGIGYNLEQLLNNIMYEEFIGNIKVVGLVSRDRMYYKKLFKYPIISTNDIMNKIIEYDYIIICSNSFKKIYNDLVENFGVLGEKIIFGYVFKITNFNFQQYICIKDSDVSIVSDTCISGNLYNRLGLRFNTPFINTRIHQDDYIKLINNIDYYINEPLHNYTDNKLNIEDINLNITKSDINWGRTGYPYGKLGDLLIHCVHDTSYDEYLIKWNKRKARFNSRNMVALMVIDNDEIAREFHESKFNGKKVGIYYKKTPYKEILCLNEWEDINIRHKFGYNFFNYVYALVGGLPSAGFCHINILDLIDVSNDLKVN